MYRSEYVEVYEDLLTTPRGASFTNLRLVTPPFACVVPVTEDGRIVFVRNHRPSVGGALLELPGGRAESGETPIAAARRELEEETGYRVRRLRPLGWFYPSPARLTARGYLFLGQGLRPGTRNLDETEDIRNVLVPVADAYRRWSAGKFHDAGTVIGLALAERFLRRNSSRARSKRLIPRVAGRHRSGVG